MLRSSSTTRPSPVTSVFLFLAFLSRLRLSVRLQRNTRDCSCLRVAGGRSGVERFCSQRYLHTQIPSDGSWLVYETLGRKINKAGAFSTPCSHTASSRPGQAPWHQRFLPGRAPQRLLLGPGVVPGPPRHPHSPSIAHCHHPTLTPPPLPPVSGSGTPAGPSPVRSPFSKASRGKLGASAVVF